LNLFRGSVMRDLIFQTAGQRRGVLRRGWQWIDARCFARPQWLGLPCRQCVLLLSRLELVR
jgi:hypothetical protein